MEKPTTPDNQTQEEKQPELRLKEEYQTSSQHNEETTHNDRGSGTDDDVEIAAHVFKGDDSDGRVNWTWKHVIATISLCGVYVGELLGDLYTKGFV